jgi:nitroreductase
MDFDKVIKTRASIRDYSDKEVKHDKIIDAIEAASLAPSPGNLSFLKYIIIDDEETITKIAQACQQYFISSAPVVIVVCSEKNNLERMYDKRASKYLKQTAGASIENFLLKITEMKLASCWIGAFSEITIKNLLKVPDEVEVEAILPIAYATKRDDSKQKPKPNLGNIVYFGTYGNKFQRPREKVRQKVQ